MQSDWLIATLVGVFWLVVGAMLGAIWDSYPDIQGYLLLGYIGIAGVIGLWILWLLAARYLGGGDQKRVVREHLPNLHPDEIKWLRQMQSGARPVGISDFIWESLERTGLVERDFSGPKGIVPGFERHVRRWIWFNRDGGRRKVVAGFLIAAGVTLFVTGLVLYNNPLDGEGAPAAPPQDTAVLTLEDLFRTDSPNANCEIIEDTLNLPTGAQERLLTRFCRTPAPELVYGGHATAAFFVPITPDPWLILRHIANNFFGLLPKSANDGTIIRGIDSGKLEQFIKDPDSKKYYMLAAGAYIYHEGELSEETKKNAEKDFERKYLGVVWRGPEYLAIMKAKREKASEKPGPILEALAPETVAKPDVNAPKGEWEGSRFIFASPQPAFTKALHPNDDGSFYRFSVPNVLPNSFVRFRVEYDGGLAKALVVPHENQQVGWESVSRDTQAGVRIADDSTTVLKVHVPQNSDMTVVRVYALWWERPSGGAEGSTAKGDGPTNKWQWPLLTLDQRQQLREGLIAVSATPLKTTVLFDNSQTSRDFADDLVGFFGSLGWEAKRARFAFAPEHDGLIISAEAALAAKLANVMQQTLGRGTVRANIVTNQNNLEGDDFRIAIGDRPIRPQKGER